MSGNEARVRLEAQRVRCLEQMVKEPNEVERRILLETYDALGIALASMNGGQGQTKYGHFKQIREAIQAYLTEIDRPATKEEIVNALFIGGLRRVEKQRQNPTPEQIQADTKTFIRKSIRFHLKNPRGIKARVIKELMGKIGLWEWKGERFE